MRKFVMVLLLGVFAVGCGKKAPDAAAQTDEQKGQGVWKLAGAELPDEPAPPADKLPPIRFLVKDNLLTVSRDGRSDLYFTFKADAAASPKTVDFTDCDEKGVPLPERDRADIRGIYKFEGDELVIALAVEGSKSGYRPTEFKASLERGDGPGKGHMVAVLKLKKADGETITPNPSSGRPKTSPTGRPRTSPTRFKN